MPKTVIGELRTVEATPALGTGAAYTIGDVLGGLLTFSMPGVPSGILRAVNLTDDDNEAKAARLYLYAEQPTSFNDNAAWMPTDADNEKLACKKITIAAGDYEVVNSNAYAFVDDLNRDFWTSNGTMWGYLVTDGTPNHAGSADLRLRLFFWPNA